MSHSFLRILARNTVPKNPTRSMSSGSSVGIIVIGDEILKGQTHDTNSHFMCQRFYKLGVKVAKISVIPDDVDQIANEVREFSVRYKHVVTSGGIGPTHDDITLEGVAKAFGEDLKLHPEYTKFFMEYALANRNVDGEYDEIRNKDLCSLSKDEVAALVNKYPLFKMCLMPESTQPQFLRNESGELISKFPIAQVHNVLIFPGIPQFLVKGFLHIEHIFKNSDVFHNAEIFCQLDEVVITPALNGAVERFLGKTVFGSYPKVDHSYYATKLTLEAKSQEELEEAQTYLTQCLPENSVVEYDKNPFEHVWEKLNRLCKADDPVLKPFLQLSVETIEECFSRYSPEEVCVSFNGGKDCTALLHLVYATYHKYYESPPPLQAIYIRNKDSFPEIENFIQECVSKYNLQLWSVSGPIKVGLGSVLESHPELKAVLMGTRKTDPFSSHLQPFQMTDPGWPQVMRVNPILDWNYEAIWKFLRRLSLPYCSMYDKGFTSIGSRLNTQPNPALSYEDPVTGELKFKPAYTLIKAHEERSGRL